ncbi:hypothetical protein [Photobacterium leiognathi]|uniref:hypothetical protein n=1 Tax=Photobacterium leiognathi TaxID=553611 RepID=UPI002982B0DC|nr:hypothetical protein [Photobacterium leiognathi]
MIDIKKTRSENSQVSILVLYDHKLESLSDSVFLGVVVKCCVSNDKSQTELSLDIGSKKPIKLMCKNNGGFLLGKLCVVDTDFKYIFPLEEKELKYALIGNIHPQVLTNRNKRILKRESPFDTKNCPECGVLVFSSKLQNHIQDKHRDKS